MTGAVPNTRWLDGCLALDDKGFVKTGPDLSSEELANVKWPLARPPYLLETSRPRIFAVGDVRGGNVKRVASAVGEGSIAVAFVHQALRDNRDLKSATPRVVCMYSRAGRLGIAASPLARELAERNPRRGTEPVRRQGHGGTEVEKNIRRRPKVRLPMRRGGSHPGGRDLPAGAPTSSRTPSRRGRSDASRTAHLSGTRGLSPRTGVEASEVRVRDVEPSLSEGILNGVDEPADIVIPPCVTQLDGIPPAERGDIQRHARFRRHPSTSDENRDHEHAFLLQGLRDLRSDEITLLLDPRAAVLVKGAQPTRADQSEQHAALGERLGDEPAEVDAGPDVRKIPHDRSVAWSVAGCARVSRSWTTWQEGQQSSGRDYGRVKAQSGHEAAIDRVAPTSRRPGLTGRAAPAITGTLRPERFHVHAARHVGRSLLRHPPQVHEQRDQRGMPELWSRNARGRRLRD